MPIGIAHRQLYPIGFPWEKQGILYELQSKRTTGPITQGSFGLFLSVDHATDQQTLKRPFWGRIPVEGWDHSLNYCLLPLPVGSRLRPAFAMWQCFQGSRPGCGRGNDDSDMGQKVPPPTWPVATPMSRSLRRSPWTPWKNRAESLTFHTCATKTREPRCPSRYSCPRGTVLKPVVSWNLSRRSSLNQW